LKVGLTTDLHSTEAAAGQCAIYAPKPRSTLYFNGILDLLAE
jgi:hypothetical protein